MRLFRSKRRAAQLRAEDTPLNNLLRRFLADMEANPDSFRCWFGGRVFSNSWGSLRHVREQGDFFKGLTFEVSKLLKAEVVVREGWRPQNFEQVMFEVPWFWMEPLLKAKEELSFRKALQYIGEAR